tara:strand:+ start:1085 stop:1441 length:357 start_codon:yes stop_codon:yes gene_type:complete
MNNDYNIYGKILGALNKDYLPRVSKNFTDSVMNKLYEDNKVINEQSSNQYLNIAASVVLAVITSFVLVSYDSMEDKFVSNDISQPEEPVKEVLIKKVIDKDPCFDQNENVINENNECK